MFARSSESSRALLGRRGEERAAWFYRLRGYRVIARNLRAPDGEVDLIARRGKLLVFAEVKTRSSTRTARGEEAVDRGKRERMVRMAGGFVRQLGDRSLMVRYDIVSLFWNGRRFELSHFPDAFRPVSDPDRPWIWRV